MRFLSVSLLFLLTLQPVFSQKEGSITWDTLGRENVSLADTDVAFSNLLTGTVSSPELAVFVMVSAGGTDRWKLFPATIADEPDRSGEYGWRAIVNLGKLDGTGRGEAYTVRVVALEKQEPDSRERPPIPEDALKSQDVVLTRVK